MSRDVDQDSTADAVRASLRAHARQAPDGELVAERILSAVGATSPERPRRFRGWRTWTLPLVAAGAVGAVVAAVATVENYHPSAHQASPANSGTASTVVSPTASSSPAASASPTTSATNHAVAPNGVSSLRGVRILDLTFTSDAAGWALASAACLHGPGRCTALLRTTDGHTWRDTGGARFNVPGVQNCAAPCVQHLRFATATTGYAYGPAALFVTDDGGRSWARQPGGAILLESFDQNVIRVTSTGAGCPGPCDVRVSTAALGSPVWTAADLPNLSGASVALSRGDADAYLLVMRNPAGGAGDATSTLYRSTSDGRHWTASGEPCPQASGEVDSSAVTAGANGRVAVLCAERSARHRVFVATSTDAGGHFVAAPGTVPAATANLLTGDPRTVLVTGGSGVARSTDGGRAWRRIQALTGDVSFIGFESSTVGRVVTDGNAIWTTRDGGASWSAVRFG